jgi:chemotaxis protein CheX
MDETLGIHQPGPALMLPDVLDLRAAAPLAAELMARRGQDTELDASRVRKLGGQCLQVLLSAQACWQAEGRRFRVVAPSSDFTEGVALLGASSLLPTFGT